MGDYYVYILTTKFNKVLYIGVTNNIWRRVKEHKTKVNSGFTKEYNVSKLVYLEKYDDPTEAIKREKQLKNWKREWKLDLIREDNPDFCEIELDPESSSG